MINHRNIEQENGETFSATFNIGWGGKIINTGDVLAFQMSILNDWHDNVTDTESVTSDGKFMPMDLFKGTLSKLFRLANQVVKDPSVENHTLPITVFTIAGSYEKDPNAIYRPTVVVQLPESLINSNRQMADAFAVLSMNFEIEQGQKVNKKIYGKDLFSMLRKPLLYYSPSLSSDLEQKYGKYFTLKKIEKSQVGTLRQDEKVTFPSAWGIWKHPDVNKYLPLLSLLTVAAPTRLMKDKAIIINDGFGNDPTNPQFMHIKLDFMQAFQELSGKYWHFSTNPIGRRTNTRGVIFVDPIFAGQEPLISSAVIPPVNLECDLGKPDSRPHKVLTLLKEFVDLNRQNNFINDPNMQTIALRAEVAKIVG